MSKVGQAREQTWTGSCAKAASNNYWTSAFTSHGTLSPTALDTVTARSRRPQSVSSGGPQNGESDFSSTSGGTTSSVQNHHRCLEGGHDIGEVDRRCRRLDRGEWQRGAGEREMVCLRCACMLWTWGGRGRSGKEETQVHGEVNAG